jgi:hypothetical protein
MSPLQPPLEVQCRVCDELGQPLQELLAVGVGSQRDAAMRTGLVGVAGIELRRPQGTRGDLAAAEHGVPVPGFFSYVLEVGGTQAKAAVSLECMNADADAVQ